MICSDDSTVRTALGFLEDLKLATGACREDIALALRRLTGVLCSIHGEPAVTRVLGAGWRERVAHAVLWC